MKTIHLVAAITIWLPPAAFAQTFTAHRTFLGAVPEGGSTTVTARFFDSTSPTPVPIEPDVVDCWVWNKGVDPAKTAPLYVCPTITDPGVASVPLDLPPFVSRIVDKNATSTERHYIKVMGQAAGKFIPLEGEFDVISDPGIVVDPTTGVPGPVLPPTPTPGA